jgi:hypothetical protein
VDIVFGIGLLESLGGQVCDIGSPEFVFLNGTECDFNVYQASGFCDVLQESAQAALDQRVLELWSRHRNDFSVPKFVVDTPGILW